MPEEARTFLLNICGLSRRLPIVRISENLSIASFVILGDTELVEVCARGIVDHPDFPGTTLELLVCPEAKAIPLTHAIARILGINYVVVRKSAKAYMENPVTTGASSITTNNEQLLVLNGPDAKALSGRNVAVIDDVVSTGGSIVALEKILADTGCRIICRAAVLLEEAGYPGDKLVYLEKLPLFPD